MQQFYWLVNQNVWCRGTIVDGEPMTEARKTRRRLTQAERSELSERRIAKAAIGLIAKRGYSRTSLAEIGRKAGYTSGLVSARFGSKQRLLREVVGRISGRFWADQITPAIADLRGLDALRAGADAYLRELGVREERLRALYVLMGEALGPLSEVREIFAELDEEFRTTVEHWLEEARRAKEIRADVDVAASATLIVAMLRGTAMQSLMAPGRIDLDRVSAALETTLRLTLAPF
jgi:AcrR family transcriptional regulator